MALVEQYKKKNQKKKRVRRLVPVIRWGLFGLGVIFLIIAIKNSIGNVVEIVELLNDKVYTGTQLKDNYAYLIGKYGEMIIGDGGSGFQVVFVNLKNAFFSGIMKLCSFASILCFISSLVFGKWLLPMYVKQMEENNQDMVNIATLENIDKQNKE